jgi:23S rRNA (uracil1939-C5)-methyltransferase
VPVNDPVCFETTIDRLAAGGDGVGRHPDGRAVFVPLSAPGDRLGVRVVESRRRFVRAEIEQILHPGPDRVAPRCAVFGVCGGCTWQHLAYPAQIEAKRAILADALQRIGGVTRSALPEVVPSPDAYGYRARARVIARRGAVGYRMRGSHATCSVDACPVLVPALEAVLPEVARRSGGDDVAREWEIAVGSEGRPRVSALDAPAPDAPAIVLGVGGDRIGLSPGAFGQANALLWDALHAGVVEAAGRGERLLELYAGAGFFTLGLARRFASVLAVESSPTAAADLRRNLAHAGCGHVQVVEGRVETVLPGLPGARPDVVVVDPPRRGLPETTARALAALAPRRIVYLSCDPATLARDVARLGAGGHALTRVRGFDLFPQTPHLEALAILEPVAPA